MTDDRVLHLRLIFQTNTITDPRLSVITSFTSVVGVYVGLPGELSILVGLSSSPIRNVIYTTKRYC